MPDLDRDAVRPVLRAGPQPRSCEASVACRTSTTMLCGQCCVPDLNRDYVRPALRADLNRDNMSSVWRAGPQPRNVSERRMSERLSEDMSERMSKDMSERMSKDLSEDMSKDMSERMSEDMSEDMSKDM